MELAPGDRVDRYVLRVRLGEGGQGEVWRADDPIDAEHPKALKLVGVASASPNQLERLRREARRLVQLKHPSLIACHALFEDLHRDLLGVVMEYADGQSLDDAMADARMTEDKRMLVLAHVAGALAYVHQRNVVHRDIKLENVVVTHAFWDAPQDPATVKLIDFGIAVESDNPKPLTKLGCVIGTPPYLAPELIDPSGWNSVGGATATSDVFAFGVLAWKLLLGHSAHPSGLPPRSDMGQYAVAYRASAGGPWPPGAPQAAWVPVIARCLALDWRARVKDGLALVAELAKAMPGVVLPTAEQAAPTPAVGEKRPADAVPTAQLGGGGPRTETAPAPAPLRESKPQPSVRTVPREPDFARWSPAPQHTSEPVVQPTPQPMPQFAPANKPWRRWLWLMLLSAASAAGLGLLAAGAAWYEGWRLDLAGTGDSALAPAGTPSGPSRPLPKAAGESTSSAVQTGSDTDPSRPAKCPVGASLCICCPSDRDCGPGGCGAQLAQTGSWDLRLWDVTTKEHPRLEKDPNLEVCVTRLRDRVSQCFNNGEALSGKVPAAALNVTYHDLTSGGLMIWVGTRGFFGSEVGRKKRAAYPKGITRLALCRGLRFVGFQGRVRAVDFYLDDPSDPPGQRFCLDTSAQ